MITSRATGDVLSEVLQKMTTLSAQLDNLDWWKKKSTCVWGARIPVILEINSLVDTGSQVSVISKNVFERLGVDLLPLEDLDVRTIAGDRLPYLGMVEVEIKETWHREGSNLLCLFGEDNSLDLILGTNFLESIPGSWGQDKFWAHVRAIMSRTSTGYIITTLSVMVAPKQTVMLSCILQSRSSVPRTMIVEPCDGNGIQF